MLINNIVILWLSTQYTLQTNVTVVEAEVTLRLTVSH
jgi:hypothetical protein